MLLGLCCPPISKQLLCHLTSGGLAADNLAEAGSEFHAPTAFVADMGVLRKQVIGVNERQENIFLRRGSGLHR